MNKERAIADAKVEAAKHDVCIVVVNAPIEMGDEFDGTYGEGPDSGPYGYCPLGAEQYVYRYGTVEVVIRSNFDKTVEVIDNLEKIEAIRLRVAPFAANRFSHLA